MQVRILQAQLDNQPQAFDDLRRQLEESEGKRRQLEAGYDALRKSGRYEGLQGWQTRKALGHCKA